MYMVKSFVFYRNIKQCSSMELEDECPSPSSPRFDRLSMKSDSDASESCGGGGAEDQGRLVVTSLLAASVQQDAWVRTAAAASLALVAESRPYLVLAEWHNKFSQERRKRTRGTPSQPRRMGSLQARSASVTARPRAHTLAAAEEVAGAARVEADPCSLLVCCLAPVMVAATRSPQLDAGDVRHRAVLGQIMATLVEELVTGPAEAEAEAVIGDMLLELAPGYMDKLMDVTLVHFQPSSATLQPVIVSSLARLARHHPAHIIPFIKSLLATTAHLIKNIKMSEMSLRLSFTNAVTQFFEAILDFNSSQSSSPANCVSVEQFHPEADTIYECLFNSWLNSARDADSKVSVLTAIASTTSFISPALLKEKCSSFILSILKMNQKFSVSLSSSLEITLCLSQILDLTNKTNPVLLEPVLDPIFNTLFQQICIIPDYNKPSSVKNHNEILRCYDTMMRNYPAKLVSGLLNKVDNSEERLKVGALTVIKHLLSLQTEILGELLEEIFNHISSKLSETNRNVQRVLAQIILLLGNHGAVAGDRGRDCIEFIIRLCGADTEQAEGGGAEGVATEPLGEMCGNILQLLTTGVPSVRDLLWPGCLEFLCSPDHEASAGAVARCVAHLATSRGAELVRREQWQQWRHATSPATLLARCLVLASVPATHHRGGHILRFLLRFSANLGPVLGSGSQLAALWEARFPLLLHYLDQHRDQVEAAQWQDWLLALVTDTVTTVAEEQWTEQLVAALTSHLPLYARDSREKSFCVLVTGQLLTRVARQDAVLDTLSSLFLVSVDRPPEQAASCARAFGVCASAHLDLVMTKLQMLLTAQAATSWRKTSFFGLLRDRSGEEEQIRELCLIVQCVGGAAARAPPPQLAQHCSAMVATFLGPLLQDCRDSAALRAAVLTAVSELAVALQAVLQHQPEFVLPRHEELLHSAISILQNAELPLVCRQQALQCLTALIELPPNITQLTRCSLLRASFSTIFASFLEHESSKTEEYTVAEHLELQLNEMVRQLHGLIRELLRQEMEPSTLDEIFTMLEPWLRLDQDLSRELSVSILHGALDTYVKGVKLGVNSPSNFTPGPYMIGAIIPRCFDPSKRVRRSAVDCVQQLLRILGLYEGLAGDTVEQSLVQLQTLNTRSNGEEAAGARLEVESVSRGLVAVLGERVQHQHLLSLLDSLADTVLDTQAGAVAGALQVMNGLVTARGSEVFQNVAGFVRKLHDKMGLMQMDETADLVEEVAEVVKNFCVHNTRGVVASLVNMELPGDKETSLIWQRLAGEPRLAAEVVTELLELVAESGQERVVAGSVSGQQCAAAVTGLGIMMDTRRLEELARAEVGGLVSTLVLLLARSLGQHFTVLAPGSGSLRRPSTAPSHQPDPVAVTLTSLRSVYSAAGSPVVAASLDTVTLADYSQLAALLSRMLDSCSRHAPQLLPALLAAHLPHTRPQLPDCVRVAAVAVVGAAAEHQRPETAASLHPGLHAALLGCCADSLPLVRRLALRGLASLAPHSADTEVRATLAALVAGVDDGHCSTVSLASLQGLVRALPHAPPAHLATLVPSLALKARPYFESSSEDHRAAAISIYSCLDTAAAEGTDTSYLEYAGTVLVPVLLHSTSSHAATSQACYTTLETIARATKFQPLIALISAHSSQDDFSVLMSGIVNCR